MVRNRLLFVLWMLGWLAVWVFGSSNMGIFIFLASVVGGTVDATLSWLSSRHLRIDLSVQATAQKKTDIPFVIQVRNDSFFGCPSLGIRICCRNLLTEERTIKTEYFSAFKVNKYMLVFAFWNTAVLNPDYA